MLVALPASACKVPAAAMLCPMAEPTLKLSPAAKVRADKITLLVVAEPPLGTRYTVAVTAPAVVLVSVQAEMVVTVLAGTV
jgi:hypothetical protein